jgi:nucleotidyltransferase/DNA polymerase involved in DNA repair
MRQDDYDTEDAASVTSGETGRSHIGSESNEFLDSFTREATDEEKIEEAIEQLTEKRLVYRIEKHCQHMSNTSI